MTRAPRPAVVLLTLALAACAAPAPIAPQPPPPLPPPPGIERLVGKPAEAVIALLGRPALDRQEGPARQLQYIRPVCVLDVFLYPKPGVAGPATVRTAIARKPDGAHMDAGQCFALIAPPATPGAPH